LVNHFKKNYITNDMLVKKIVFVATLLSFTCLSSITAWAAAPTFDDSLAASLLAKVNSYRVSQGKTALKSSGKLSGIAKGRVTAIYTSNSLINPGDPSHNIPGFGGFASHSKVLGLPTPDAEGENFTVSTRGLDALYSNWIGSPSHLANILDDKFVYTGVAVSINLEEVGDPQIPTNIAPRGLVAIQVFTSADAIDGKSTPSTPAPAPTNTTPSTNTNSTTPVAKPATTPKPAATPAKTVTKPKIDKTQKVGSKIKFEEIKMIFTKVFEK
jgi:uncharacterized protein YkwD